MTVHPFHDVSAGDHAPEVVNTIVEIGRGGTIKYELDKATGLLRMDRVLYSAVHFPANYGFIPQSWGEDDDPLDILILCQFAVQPLTLMEAKPIGMLTMDDQGKADHKIIAVATADPEYSGFDCIDQLPPHRLRTVQRFFLDYKQLEGVEVDVRDMQSVEVAHRIIAEACQRYRRKRV
ncbi:inorganic diphosphatase [Roseimaritima sediminicola]|uniref:inorganic diphosphatase n=1 Tax=Roseimaritima sediminicola TaxID=2662066 RepID=UPI0012984747|nr:inorganic diphosphatase [Roseimaritima sediminicola]